MFGTNVDINEISALKDEILKEINKTKQLSLDMSRVETIDSSGIQLIISTILFAERSNIKKIELTLSDAVKATIEKYGFKDERIIDKYLSGV